MHPGAGMGQRDMLRPMERTFAALGALSAALAVAAGAFGAHALKGHLSPEELSVFETGARYQMYHALALLAVAWAATRWPGSAVHAAGWLFVIGTLLFSGLLYALVWTNRTILGAVVPIGGTMFIIGWLALAWGVFKHKIPIVGTTT